MSAIPADVDSKNKQETIETKGKQETIPAGWKISGDLSKLSNPSSTEVVIIEREINPTLNRQILSDLITTLLKNSAPTSPAGISEQSSSIRSTPASESKIAAEQPKLFQIVLCRTKLNNTKETPITLHFLFADRYQARIPGVPLSPYISNFKALDDKEREKLHWTFRYMQQFFQIAEPLSITNTFLVDSFRAWFVEYMPKHLLETLFKFMQSEQVITAEEYQYLLAICPHQTLSSAEELIDRRIQTELAAKQPDFDTVVAHVEHLHELARQRALSRSELMVAARNQSPGSDSFDDSDAAIRWAAVLEKMSPAHAVKLYAIITKYLGGKFQSPFLKLASSKLIELSQNLTSTSAQIISLFNAAFGALQQGASIEEFKKAYRLFLTQMSHYAGNSDLFKDFPINISAAQSVEEIFTLITNTLIRLADNLYTTRKILPTTEPSTATEIQLQALKTVLPQNKEIETKAEITLPSGWIKRGDLKEISDTNFVVFEKIKPVMTAELPVCKIIFTRDTVFLIFGNPEDKYTSSPLYQILADHNLSLHVKISEGMSWLEHYEGFSKDFWDLTMLDSSYIGNPSNDPRRQKLGAVPGAIKMSQYYGFQTSQMREHLVSQLFQFLQDQKILTEEEAAYFASHCPVQETPKDELALETTIETEFANEKIDFDKIVESIIALHKLAQKRGQALFELRQSKGDATYYKQMSFDDSTAVLYYGEALERLSPIHALKALQAVSSTHQITDTLVVISPFTSTIKEKIIDLQMVTTSKDEKKAREERKDIIKNAFLGFCFAAMEDPISGQQLFKQFLTLLELQCGYPFGQNFFKDIKYININDGPGGFVAIMLCMAKEIRARSTPAALTLLKDAKAPKGSLDDSDDDEPEVTPAPKAAKPVTSRTVFE